MTKQPKFNVKYGTWSTDFIIVDADELEKLHYAKKKGAFFAGKYGDVDTTKIISVRPDYKETYGAATEYELVGEDYDEIRQAHGDIRNLIGESENRVRHLIENHQENLIGTGVSIPQLSQKNDRRDEEEGGMKSINDLL